jgi:hypothetical protein
MNCMHTLILAALLLTPPQIPKNDPNGIWTTNTGTEYEISLVGADLQVRIVPGSNPTYLEYTVDLMGTEEPNTYNGKGQFKARLQNGRECEFDTMWQIVIVTDDRIIGAASQIVPNPETCEVLETGNQQLLLQRKQ